MSSPNNEEIVTDNPVKDSTEEESTASRLQALANNSPGAEENKVEEDAEAQHADNAESNQTDDKNDVSGNNDDDGNTSSLEPEQFRKVFVGGLNYRTTEESLRKYFEKCGKILDCTVMFDQSGRSRGFGFITFASSADVDKVMSERPHTIDGREVDVKRATPREQGYDEHNPKASYYQQWQRASVKKIFIGAIRDGIKEEDLRSYFSKFGNVVDCTIMKTPDGRLRGFGFLEFDDCDPVDKAVLERHHNINGTTVDVKKAIPRTWEQSNQQPSRYTPYNAGFPQYPGYNVAAGYRPRMMPPVYGLPAYPRGPIPRFGVPPRFRGYYPARHMAPWGPAHFGGYPMAPGYGGEAQPAAYNGYPAQDYWSGGNQAPYDGQAVDPAANYANGYYGAGYGTETEYPAATAPVDYGGYAQDGSAGYYGDNYAQEESGAPYGQDGTAYQQAPPVDGQQYMPTYGTYATSQSSTR